MKEELWEQIEKGIIRKGCSMDKKLFLALYHGKEYVRDGHIIVNPIGEALYVDVFRVTPEELREIWKMKLKGLI
ncbi:MAG: hypothetical protein QW734_07090 [Candidatus Bathyarchaeia archaeon]